MAAEKIQIAINNTNPEISFEYAQDPNYVITGIRYNGEIIALYTRRNRGSTYDGLIVDLFEPGHYKYTHHYPNRPQRPTSTKEHYSQDSYADWLTMFSIIQRHNQSLRGPELDFENPEFNDEFEDEIEFEEINFNVILNNQGDTLRDKINELGIEINPDVYDTVAALYFRIEVTAPYPNDETLIQIIQYIIDHPFIENDFDAYMNELAQRFNLRLQD